MGRRVVVWAVVVLVLMVGCSRPAPVAREGAPAPTPEFRDINGARWSPADFRGKLVVVHFWATWCGPCRVELPELERLYRDYKGKPVQILPVLYNDDPSRALAFLQARGFRMPLLVDETGAGAARYGLTGVPETYLIDKKGILRKKFIGSVSWDAPDVRSILDTLISE